jgi:hypothetical protein
MTNLHDEQIKEFYKNPDRKRGDLKKFANELNVSENYVASRCTKLGLNSFKKYDKPWSDAEYNIVESNKHMHIATIQKILEKHGYHRTGNAISRIKTMVGEGSGFVMNRHEVGIFSANQLSILLGLKHETIIRYIRLGYLKTEKSDGIAYNIKKNNVKQFMVNYRQSIDFGKIDKEFLIDILTS